MDAHVVDRPTAVGHDLVVERVEQDPSVPQVDQQLPGNIYVENRRIPLNTEDWRREARDAIRRLQEGHSSTDAQVRVPLPPSHGAILPIRCLTNGQRRLLPVRTVRNAARWHGVA